MLQYWGPWGHGRGLGVPFPVAGKDSGHEIGTDVQGQTVSATIVRAKFVSMNAADMCKLSQNKNNLIIHSLINSY